MDLNKSGIKLLIGRKVSLVPRKETRVQFDFFLGLGYQYLSEEITRFKSKSGECDIEG